MKTDCSQAGTDPDDPFDKDGDIDGNDQVIFADAFGSSSGGPDYNPVADFDGDGYVDESDLAACAAEFGAY